MVGRKNASDDKKRKGSNDKAHLVVAVPDKLAAHSSHHSQHHEHHHHHHEHDQRAEFERLEQNGGAGYPNQLQVQESPGAKLSPQLALPDDNYRLTDKKSTHSHRRRSSENDKPRGHHLGVHDDKHDRRSHHSGVGHHVGHEPGHHHHEHEHERHTHHVQEEDNSQGRHVHAKKRYSGPGAEKEVIVTYQESPPLIKGQGRGQGQNTTVEELLSEGTQTQRIPKPKATTNQAGQANLGNEEDELTPFWQLELEKGREHLRRHQVAYLRAHRTLTQSALKASEYDLEDGQQESVASIASKATIYPGTEEFEGVSPALMLLNQIDRIFFQHRVEIIDGIALCFDKVKNSYDILNGSGHRIFRLEEEKSKSCCGFCNGFKLAFFDSDDQEVIRMVKKTFDMYSPPDYFIGSIEQKWKYRKPEFAIKDLDGTVIMFMTLEGSFFCGFGKSQEMQFMVRTTRGNPRGRVAGDWPDLKRATFSTHDAYGVHFPGEMSVVWKCLILGGAFMVYHAYYDGMVYKLVSHHVGRQARALVDFEVEPSRRSSASSVTVIL